MKIALITGGEPRFTPAFSILLNQFKGFDSADLYFAFWKSEWAMTDEQAKLKIEKVLPNNIKLAKVKLYDAPKYQLPNPKLQHVGEHKDSIRWAYKRRSAMWQGLKLAYDLIDNQDYDLVIRYRIDCRLEHDLDLRQITLPESGLLFPQNHRAGTLSMQICDQFAIGNMQSMKFYTRIADHFDQYLYEFCPQWETTIVGWCGEEFLAHHLIKNNVQQDLGNFRTTFKSDGRSAFDENHTFLHIGQDPTSI